MTVNACQIRTGDYLKTFFSIYNRARSVPNIFANNQDDILARSSVETWVIKGVKGNADCCKKCDGKVFEAEKLTTASVIILM